MIDFVGAGPGAADLITVRGKARLEQADIVIYAGSLVNPELLSYIKKGCQIYNSASMTLEEVIAVMEEGEKQEVFLERMMEEDVFARILTTVKQLPPQCGKVMLLTLKGYKISEVAEFMGISLETAKEYKKDGKKRLYNKLKGGIYSIFIGILFS